MYVHIYYNTNTNTYLIAYTHRTSRANYKWIHDDCKKARRLFFNNIFSSFVFFDDELLFLFLAFFSP